MSTNAEPLATSKCIGCHYRFRTIANSSAVSSDDTSVIINVAAVSKLGEEIKASTNKSTNSAPLSPRPRFRPSLANTYGNQTVVLAAPDRITVDITHPQKLQALAVQVDAFQLINRH